MNAQILLGRQMSISVVEKFFVISAHFCILLGVFEKPVFVCFILGSIQRLY